MDQTTQQATASFAAVPGVIAEEQASDAQERLWLRGPIERDSWACNVSVTVRISLRLNVEALRQSLAAIVQRHEGLQTRFTQRQELGLRVTLSEVEVSWQTVNLQNIGNAAQRARQLNKRLAACEKQPFHSSGGPLLRCYLYTLGAAEHVLQLVCHHSVFDVWSIRVLMNELGALYRAFDRGQSPSTSLSPLKIQYKDCAQRQRELLQIGAAASLRTYWSQQLAGLPLRLDLPIGRPSPVASRRRERVTAMLPTALVAAVKLLAQRSDTTFFTTLLAAFNVLLFRYTGSTDIAVGAPVPGRDAAELETLIGCFGNIVILRCRIEPECSFAWLLQQLKKTVCGAYQHQEMPFEQLRELLQVSRSAAQVPLVEVTFDLQDLQRRETDLGEIETISCGSLVEVSLGLQALDCPGGLRCSLEYAADSFDRGTVVRMLEHFEVLLGGVVVDARQAIARLPLLTPHERQQILVTWNDTAHAAAGGCIHRRFETRAAERPSAVALCLLEESVTYEELNQRSNRLARYLIEHAAAGPESRVALCIDRCVELLVAVLAILKSGAAYVPIDPKLPSQRIQFILADSGASLLLTQRSLRHERLKDVLLPMFLLDGDCVELARFESTNVITSVAGHHCAYVIYTSGSTGRPKGVMVTHDSVMNTLGFLETRYPVEETDSCLLKTSCIFDISLTELFGWFMGRGRLVILPLGMEGSPDLLLNYIVDHRITHINFSPSLLRGFLLEAQRDSRLSSRTPLKYVMVGAEAFPKQLVEQAIAVLQPAAVEDLYGPTEAAIYCTSWSCAAPIESHNTPIGRPLSNFEAFVLDEYLQPVPIGVVGELCIAGRGLARGYVNRPDLTAEKFIANPFGSGTKLYKTGDRVRWLPQGELEYLGRKDHQVKVRGMRVELGEIETRMMESGLVQVAVVLQSATSGVERLIGYVVPAVERAACMGLSDDGVADAIARDEFICDVRQALQAALPDYMVPAAYVVLSRLPLTPAGKADRKALAALPVESGERQIYVLPRTESERVLCSIWQDVLRTEKVGIRDNFFASGGDSILSIQVAFKAKAQGIYLSARQLFEHQTIEELAAHARVMGGCLSQQDCVGDLVLPPTHRQFLEPDSTAVHQYYQYRILPAPTGLTQELLHKAAAALYRQHDALRLRYVRTADEWRAHFAEVSVSMVDATLLAEPSAHARQASGVTPLEEWVGIAGESLDIENGPLLKVVLVGAADPSAHRLLLVLHYLIADEVSWRVIAEDLLLALRQCQAGQPIELPPKSHSYQEWAAALLDYRDRDALVLERDYWLANLRHPVEPLPVDRVTPAEHLRSVGRQVLWWCADETAALLDRCSLAYRTRTGELLLAGLLLAMFRWTGHKAVRVVVAANSRQVTAGDAADFSRTVGSFISYYPLILSLPDTEGELREDTERFCGELIKAVKERCRAVPNGGLGYGVLRYLARDDSIAAAESSAALEIAFNCSQELDAHGGVQIASVPAADLRGAACEGARQRRHLLGFTGLLKNQRLSVEIDYNSHQFEVEAVSRLAEMYTQALREIIIHCARPDMCGFTPSDFPLAHLRQREIDHWQALYPELENIYPITGLQLGLLFHSRLGSSGATYSNQMWVTLRGEFNVSAFKEAWAFVVSRHAIFRTAFVGLEREQALQLIVRAVTPLWRELDHRDLHGPEAESAFEQCRLSDKNQQFNFSRPLLMRLALIRATESAYRFIWTYHHSILDGWSGVLIWNEVLEAYHALAQRGTPRLLPVRPYSDYIQWLQQQDRSCAESYWRRELAGVARATALTIDGQAPARSGVDSSPIVVELTEVQTSRLQEAARSSQVTLATLIQAAWAWLLHWYCAEESVVFGVTVSGRAIDLPGVEAISGLFINTVPARVVIDKTQRVVDWLRSIQQAQVERETYGFVPLLDIQSYSGIRAGTALFDSVLVIENHPLTIVRTNTQLEAVDYQNDAQTHYGLTLLVMPGERLSLSLQFDSSRFDRIDVSAMADRLVSIFQHFSSVSPGEAVRALYAPQPKAAPPEIASHAMTAPPSRVLRQGELRLGRYLVHQLIENQARKLPDKVAVCCDERTYTYDALNRLANRMANRLLDQYPGLKADSLVGVLLPRSDKLLVTILAIWKAGATYIPLDPGLPNARIQLMLQNANASLVIADHASLAWHPHREWGIPVVTWDDVTGHVGQSDADPDINVSGHDLCYVIYTSGSTGVPKGAMVEHIGMLNNIANKVVDLEITDSSRIAQTASQSFDISVWQLFIALTQGATTVIYDDRTINDIGRFIQRLKDDGIGVVEMVPSYLVLVTEYLAGCPRERLPTCLQFLVLTGESADAAFIRQWFHYFPATRVVNAYGPTEASDDITHHVMTSGDDIVNPIPIGRALANFDIYVVDESLRPVPIGEKGEIVVTGVGVGRGYVNLAGATANAFVDSPFPDKYQGRLYKTGDVGQMQADGLLLFHGRKDGQVKVRGFRIELEEVEIKLLESVSVRQAVVLDITSPGTEAFLCAFVVPYGNVDKEALLGELRGKLPAYMVPTELRFLDKLPTLPNGKVDRRALRDLRGTALAGAAYRAPTGELEIRLAGIWREVLRAERIGVDDDFFDLGGDSFKAIRIAAKYGGALEVTDIYNLKTIAALAGRLEQSVQTESRRIVLVAGGHAAKVAVLGIANSAGDPVSFFELGRELTALGDEMALYAVKLPRRPVEDVAAMTLEIERLTAEICAAVAQEIKAPLIVFGQCNGSALAISIARRLQKTATPPRALCIGGALLRTCLTPTDKRNDREILDTLKAIGATLPQQPDELAFFLSDFRYDCELADCYYNGLVAELNAGSPVRIDAPIFCISGSEDPLISGYAHRFTDWARISDDVSLIEFHGYGHYLLRDCPRDLALATRNIWRSLEASGLDEPAHMP